MMNKCLKIAAVAGAALIAGAAQASGHVITHAGDVPSKVGSHATFTGQVRHDSLAKPDADSHYSVSVVTFEPGARTFWHTHPAGQRMLVVFGKGLVGTVDGKVDVVRLGDNIWCPAGVKHWHGAAPDTAMAHLVITNVKNGKNVDWMEEVSEDDYKRFAKAATDALKKGGNNDR